MILTFPHAHSKQVQRWDLESAHQGRRGCVSWPVEHGRVHVFARLNLYIWCKKNKFKIRLKIFGWKIEVLIFAGNRFIRPILEILALKKKKATTWLCAVKITSWASSFGTAAFQSHDPDRLCYLESILQPRPSSRDHALHHASMRDILRSPPNKPLHLSRPLPIGPHSLYVKHPQPGDATLISYEEGTSRIQVYVA